MVHALKIRTEYFEAVKNGTKTFETRFDDRGFVVGDYLALNEIDENGKYTGNALIVEVTYILREPDFCKDGFAIMSISPCRVLNKHDFDIGGIGRWKLTQEETK